LFDAEPPQPGHENGFSVRNSARAKRLSIKVFPRGRVEVVVPRRTSARSVQAFVAENRDWIDRARESFAQKFTPESAALPSLVRLPSIDRQYIVRYVPVDQASTVRYREAHGILTLRGATADRTLCVGALKRWLSATARRAFLPRLEALSRQTEAPFDRMHIRLQRTCWGSRSCSGTISLNLCLLFLKPSLLNYLLVHELCHGRHMNHSRRFWKRVGQFVPDYRRLDRQLGESWRVVPAWLGIY
jgi:hypothetical protein